MLRTALMPRRYIRQLKQPARELRRHMTAPEQALWARLRGKQIEGFQFYRQRPVGRFIVDFYAPSAKLVIEVDGGWVSPRAAAGGDRPRTILLVGGTRVQGVTLHEQRGGVAD